MRRILSQTALVSLCPEVSRLVSQSRAEVVVFPLLSGISKLLETGFQALGVGRDRDRKDPVPDCS